jgi:flagellar export protein FliJ
MKKFSFRLSRVLDYRRKQEHDALMAWLGAQVLRRHTEKEIADLMAERARVVTLTPQDLVARLETEAYIEALDDRRAILESVLTIQRQEEAAAREEWEKKKRATKTLEQLRENAWRHWLRESSRYEQRALDEWATMRSVAP